MTESQFGRLLADLWSDLQEPAILWQAGTLALCLMLAWWLARMLQWRAPDDSMEALKRGAAAFRRLVFPLLAVLLLFAGRAVLRNWHSTNLFSVAIPLFGAMAGIRFVVYLLRLAFSDGSWLDAFERSIATVVWAALAMHLTGILPEIVRWLSEVELPAGRHTLSLWILLNAAFWVLLTLLLALWAGVALEVRLLRAESLHTRPARGVGAAGEGGASGGRGAAGVAADGGGPDSAFGVRRRPRRRPGSRPAKNRLQLPVRIHHPARSFDPARRHDHRR